MSKLVVKQIVERALADINRRQNEAQLPEQFKRIQDAFKNNVALAGQESLAILCGLITGFTPRTTNQKIVPFEVFGVMSKAEQRVTRWALCMASANGSAWGCASLSEVAVNYTAESCVIADEEQATEFITHEVASWEDSAVLNWVNNSLGAGAFPKFFSELDRSLIAAAPVAAAAKK